MNGFPDIEGGVPQRSELFQKLKAQISGLDGGIDRNHLVGFAEVLAQVDIESVVDPAERNILEGLYDKRLVEAWQAFIRRIMDPQRGSKSIPEAINSIVFYDEGNRAQVMAEYEEKIDFLRDDFKKAA